MVGCTNILAYFDPKIYTLSKKLQFSHYHVNQHFSADATMQCTATLIFYLLCPLKQEKKHPQKWDALSKIAEIFRTSSQPKNSTDIKLFFTKIAHHAPYIQ